MNKKPLKQVVIAWKYSVLIKKNVIDIRFPQVSFDKKDVRGKEKFTKNQWIKKALDFYNKEKKTSLTVSEIKDCEVFLIRN